MSNGHSNDAKKMRTLVKQSLTNCLLSNERKKVGICKAIDICDTVGYSPATQSLSQGQSSPFCRIRVVKGSSCCKDPMQANETTFPIWHFETCKIPGSQRKRFECMTSSLSLRFTDSTAKLQLTALLKLCFLPI